MGTTLYVYGGGWNWQDDGASIQAVSSGLLASWSKFFCAQTADYTYKAEEPEQSHYPCGSYNQYYCAGADCSGYLGWTRYNVMNTTSGGDGFVGSFTGMACRLA